MPEPAIRHDLTAAELESRLAKTGGTPFYCQSVRSVIDPGLSVSAAEINRLRRDVLAHLTAVRGRLEPTQIGTYSEPRRFAGAKSAVLCDLMENELEELKVEAGKVSFTAKPFEIITVKFK